MRLRPAPAAGIVVALVVLVAAAPVPAQAGPRWAPKRAACRAGHVAMTFDDGPQPGVTTRLLRVLRARHVPATFFVNGAKVAAAPRAARQVERGGFLVANHGYDHADMTRLPQDSIVSTIRRTDLELHRAGVHPLHLLRPPYGAVDADVYAAARRTHHTVVLWTVDPRDWDYRSADAIADSVLAQLHRGDNVVLLHDGVVNSPRSVDAVPRIIATARRRGFCLVGLDERGRPGFPTPTATLSVDRPDRRVREGDRLRATITLPYPAGRATSLRLAIDSDTGSVGRDLRLRTRKVQVPAGATTVRVRIPVRRDGLDEETERFELGVQRGVGLRATSGVVSVAVEDRDPPPEVSGGPVDASEPAAGTAQVPVTFRLSAPSGRDVRLTYRTVDGTAGPSDYIATSGVATIPAGATSAVVPVTVYADLVPEGPETFTIHLDRAEHARVAVRDAVVTIRQPGGRPAG